MFAGQRTPPDTLVCYVATHLTDTLVNYIHQLSVSKKYRKNKTLDLFTLAIFLPIYYKKNILSNALNYKLFVNIFVLY